MDPPPAPPAAENKITHTLPAMRRRRTVSVVWRRKTKRRKVNKINPIKIRLLISSSWPQVTRQKKTKDDQG